MQINTAAEHDCAILIPTHKEDCDPLELESLENTLKVFEKRQVYILLPADINKKYYVELSATYQNLQVINLRPGFLGSIENYNTMALSAEFYTLFKQYEYVLICHLDSWVFRDEINQWMKSGYDYVGAPLFLPDQEDCHNIWQLASPVGGNGGFCLRRTAKMLQLCSNFKKNPNYLLALQGAFFLLLNKRYDLFRIYLYICKSIWVDADAFQKKHNVYEDVMISVLYALLDKSLNVAPPKIAAKFALEVNLDEIRDTQLDLILPCGLHGIGKHFSNETLNACRLNQATMNQEQRNSDSISKPSDDALPRVTVITIVKDIVKSARTDMLRQCMDSVLQQTYPNLEYLIIDGASEDGTLELLKEYENHASVRIFSSPDEGIWDAMNKGILLASGEFINVMNSDDYFCNENAISIAVDLIKKTGVDWFYADATIIRSDQSQYTFPTSLYGVFSCMGIVHQTMLVKKSLIIASDAFVSQHKTRENYLMMKLLMNGLKPAYYPHPLVHYREGGYSTDAYGGGELEKTKHDFSEYFYALAGRRWGLSKEDCYNMFGWQLFGTKGLEYSLKLGLKLRPVKLKIDFYKKLLSFAMHHRGIKSIFQGVFRYLFNVQ